MVHAFIVGKNMVKSYLTFFNNKNMNVKSKIVNQNINWSEDKLKKKKKGVIVS